MGNEKKDPLQLWHTWFSQPSLWRLGFVPAPIPAGRAETTRSRFSHRHFSPFSARAQVQKGYFKIKPCLPCSDETRGELSSESCSLPFPETFYHSASENVLFTLMLNASEDKCPRFYSFHSAAKTCEHER